jgi:hypothetical protein
LQLYRINIHHIHVRLCVRIYPTLL